MASTYSIVSSGSIALSLPLGNVGYGPSNPQLPVMHQIEDAFVPNGAKLGAAANNTRIQSKRNDGRISYFTIDAERSDPSKNLIFLLPTPGGS